jgi:beta-lactamase superfamily II metal-dependent hydrolase
LWLSGWAAMLWRPGGGVMLKRVWVAWLGIGAGLLVGAGMAAGQSAAVPAPPKVAAGVLQVYFIDVDGGQSTLFVTPEGRSLLVDTGWDDQSGRAGRDAKRIVAAMGMAHIAKLDAVLITHYHLDHVGGVAELAERVPIGMFLDHGVNREDAGKETEDARHAYEALVATGRGWACAGAGVAGCGCAKRLLCGCGAEGAGCDGELAVAGVCADVG